MREKAAKNNDFLKEKMKENAVKKLKKDDFFVKENQTKGHEK